MKGAKLLLPLEVTEESADLELTQIKEQTRSHSFEIPGGHSIYLGGQLRQDKLGGQLRQEATILAGRSERPSKIARILQHNPQLNFICYNWACSHGGGDGWRSCFPRNLAFPHWGPTPTPPLSPHSQITFMPVKEQMTMLLGSPRTWLPYGGIHLRIREQVATLCSRPSQNMASCPLMNFTLPSS